MTKEELLAALLVERYTSPWWTTKPEAERVDDDLACARRRRALDEAREDRDEVAS